MKYMNEAEFNEANIFGKGQANTMFAQYFIGDSFLNPLTELGKDPLFLANVTFEPGCRNNWHIHHASKNGGQILICTAGEGWYQEEGREQQHDLDDSRDEDVDRAAKVSGHRPDDHADGYVDAHGDEADRQ